jgi:alpha-maltose-1-phosphate synthase
MRYYSPLRSREVVRMLAEVTQLVGVMGGGMIGADPFGEHSWSGSSKYFFRELQRQGRLHAAFGVDASKLSRAVLALRYPSLNLAVWRQRHYLDTAYYSVLARKIARKLLSTDAQMPVLQLGGTYMLRNLIGSSRRMYSYHDGNLAVASRSPYFPLAATRRYVERALRYERAVYEGMDLIFTMSAYLRASFIEDFSVDPGRVVAVGAGINLDSIPDESASKQKILFVGADFSRKGGDLLLQAFRIVRSKYSDAELIVIGPRALAIPTELSAGIRYLGFLSRRDPSQRKQFESAMAEASIFVMPSLYEPFGIAPLEAMANQIPALLSDAWAFPEMVQPGVNGDLVTVGSVPDLADKICAMLEDPERLRAMGMEARRTVLATYTWDAVARRLTSAIDKSSQGRRYEQ